MTVQVTPQPGRRFVFMRIGVTGSMATHGPLRFVRRLNRFLAGSGLVALSQGSDRIVLMGLKQPVSAQDTGLVMLWLSRQPQVGAVGLEQPTTADLQVIARIGHGEH